MIQVVKVGPLRRLRPTQAQTGTQPEPLSLRHGRGCDFVEVTHWQSESLS